MTGGDFLDKKNEKTQKISLYLHKVGVEAFDDCIETKSLEFSNIHNVKSDIGLEGRIFVHIPTVKVPEWKEILDILSVNTVDVTENTSNKAVVVFKYSGRFLSIVFGYGKAMLNEDTIERNFGLVVAANLIDSNKIRSLNSMTIEDTVLDYQKQSFSLSSQDKFQIDPNKEILKLVSGAPHSETVAKFLVGTDSLTATRKMDIQDIKESIRYYFNVYQKDDYKRNGFGWLDNIKRVKDKSVVSHLDSQLEENILGVDTSVVIGPNKIVDWENITGFYLTGTGQKRQNSDIFSIELNYEEYINFVQSRNRDNVIAKLKRDKILAKTDTGEEFTISNVYDGVIFETVHDHNRCILCYGEWFEINTDFYSEIRNEVISIPKCELQFPACMGKLTEGEYNEMVANSSFDYFLMDKQNYTGKGYGQSKIEPCDILTIDKKFIHVKFGGSSATLSHLFAQGVVSARIFGTDDEMRKFINKKVRPAFGNTFIKKIGKQNSDFEIVYAIIDHRNDKDIVDVLPFFSLVNLAKAKENLQSMGYKYSLMKIEQRSDTEENIENGNVDI